MNNEVYENQLIDHTLALLSHGHTKTMTGTLLRTSLECLVMEAGVGGDPGSFDVRQMAWLTKDTWVGSTLKAYNKYELELELEANIEGLRMWNTRDEYIMERAYDIATEKDLIIFNKVCLFLRVATVSDLTTADGKKLDLTLLQGKRSTSPSFSEFAYTWPNIPEPTTSEIKTWYTIISMMFSIMESNTRIREEATFKWDIKSIQYSKWTIGRNGKYVFERNHDHWRKWKRQKCGRRRRQGMTYKFKKTVSAIEAGVIPITVNIRDDNLISVLHKGKVISFEDEPEDRVTGWILPQVDSTDTDESIFARQLIQGNGITVSDSSYKNHRSSASFTTAPEKAIQGSLTIPGNKNDQSSYRAELGGILASIVYTNKIAKKYDIPQGTCTMICDNKGALDSSFGFKQINP